MAETDEVAEWRSDLAAAVDRVRHPDLGLVHFVSRESECADTATEDEASVPAEEQAPARLRRAALVVAAAEIIDRCISDLRYVGFGEDGLPLDSDEADDTFVYEAFPGRFRAAYDEEFFRKVLVTATKVAQDLADPHGGPAACTAEEIIRRAIGELAMHLWDITGLGPAVALPEDLLLEDTDFGFLYDEEFDGLEDDPVRQAGMNVEVPRARDWFAPFNDDRVVHPYAETRRSPGPRLHDLRQRLSETGESPLDLLETAVVDADDPVSSLAAGSEIVAHARRARDQAEPDLWVADDTAPEASFAALVAAAGRAEQGSGWLTWEPYDGADTVRTDPVIFFAPHRHFPIGEDEPWADAALSGGHLLGVPLKFVVSYRPDPEVRRRWENVVTFHAP